MNNPIDIVRHVFPGDCHKKVFLVGGCVRDQLLGRAKSDIDLISALTPDEMNSCGFRLVTGKSTAPIWFRHDEITGSIEATLIADAGAALFADLSCRDFTINAMAVTLDGEIVDPLNGRNDLDLRVLRACSPQIFGADPLRIFRALRFEADGYRMVPDTEQLIRERDWSGAWAAIPMERFSRELLKAISLQEPERFFQRLLDLNVGAEYVPEIFRMPNIPAGPLIHHPEGDLFSHSCQVLERVSVLTLDPLARFCAMFHDIGKLTTAPDQYPKHHGHDQAGFKMALEFCQRLRLPAHYGTSLSWISRLHGTFNLWDKLRDATKLRLADQAVKAGIVDILPLVAAADKAGGSEPVEWRKVVTAVGISASDLGISLQLLEGIPPSKRSDFIRQVRIEKLRLTRTVST